MKNALPVEAELLAMATEFEVASCRKWRWWIRVTRIDQPDGTYKWGVYYNRSEIWDRIAKDFVWDPQPSSRTKRYYIRTRFATLLDAWKQAQKAVALIRTRDAQEEAEREEMRLKKR